jgi:hypothetical protein
MQTSSTADDAFQKLAAIGEIAGGVSEVDIEAAEGKLGLAFPQQYREFLRSYGAAILPGTEIFGLVDASRNDPPLWTDIREITGKLRSAGQVGAGDQCFLPISEDGTGVYFYLNTAVAPDVEIWALGPGVRQLIGHDLFAFASTLASGQLAF